MRANLTALEIQERPRFGQVHILAISGTRGLRFVELVMAYSCARHIAFYPCSEGRKQNRNNDGRLHCSEDGAMSSLDGPKEQKRRANTADQAGYCEWNCHNRSCHYKEGQHHA